jgi:hypothetical protein
MLNENSFTINRFLGPMMVTSESQKKKDILGCHEHIS